MSTCKMNGTKNCQKTSHKLLLRRNGNISYLYNIVRGINMKTKTRIPRTRLGLRPRSPRLRSYWPSWPLYAGLRVQNNLVDTIVANLVDINWIVSSSAMLTDTAYIWYETILELKVP